MILLAGHGSTGLQLSLTFKAERARPASVASGSKILLKPIVSLHAVSDLFRPQRSLHEVGRSLAVDQ